ncbi:hypothetical protein F5Y04DRAFT_285841 [Hypomontagnella monticulosa]|nr:hypothetical protein F5Y04DRAFT_285841 [Hypomontagnella monticulosa]
MFFFLYAVLTIALLAARSCAAPQDDWVFPVWPDQTSELVSGNKYTIRWNANLKNWFREYCDACDTKDVDLWVMGGNNFHRLASGVNVETTLSYTWTADIPSEELNVDLWVFRFLASGVDFEGADTQNIASPIFFLREGDGGKDPETVGQTTPTKAIEEPVSTRVDETTKTKVVEVTKTKEEQPVKTEAISENPGTKADTSISAKATETSATPTSTGADLAKTSLSSTTPTKSSTMAPPSTFSSSTTSLVFDPINTGSATDPTLIPHGTASPNAKDSSSNSGLSKGAMIGIGVGVGVSAVIACFLWFFCAQRRKNRRNQPVSPSTIKGGRFAHDEESGVPRGFEGHGPVSRLGTAQTQDGIFGAGVVGVPADVSPANSIQESAAGYGIGETAQAPNVPVVVGTAPNHDNGIRLQKGESVAELEYMPIPELPATPVAAELPAHGYVRFENRDIMATLSPMLWIIDGILALIFAFAFNFSLALFDHSLALQARRQILGNPTLITVLGVEATKETPRRASRRAEDRCGIRIGRQNTGNAGDFHRPEPKMIGERLNRTFVMAFLKERARIQVYEKTKEDKMMKAMPPDLLGPHGPCERISPCTHDMTIEHANEIAQAFAEAEGLDPKRDMITFKISRIGDQRMERRLDEAENAIQGQLRLPEVGRILPIDLDGSESQAGGSQAGSSVATRGFPGGQEGRGRDRGRRRQGRERSGSSLGGYHQGSGGATAVTPHLDQAPTDTKGRRSYRQADEEDELAELDRQLDEYMLTDEGVDQLSTSLAANPLDDSPPGDDDMDCAGN